MNKTETHPTKTPTHSGLNGLGFWFVMVSLLFIRSQPLMAQCPDAQEVYQQVETISAGTDLNRIIAQLLQLNQTVVKCSIQNDSIHAKLLHVLGRTYWYIGDLKNGIIYMKEAIRFNERLSKTARRANLANSYYNLGRVVIQQTKPQQALQLFDQAIQIASNYPEKYLQAAKAYAQKAYLYFVLGDYEQSQRDAEQGYVFARQSNDRPQMIDNLIQQTQALIKLKRYSSAEKALLSALHLNQTIANPQLIAKIYSALAECYMASGQHEAVVQYYMKAFSVDLKNNYREGCAQILASLGYYYRSIQHDYTQAIKSYKQALTFLDKDSFSVRIRILNNIGYVYWQQKDHRQALSFYQQALITAPIGFADHSITANPSAQTIRLISEKEYLLTLIQDKADTWLDYAKATGNDRKRLQYALNTYTVADQMIDFMRWEHTGQQSKLFWRDKTRGMYERAIETCYRLNNAEQAFRFMEKSRAVMLADKLNELGAQQQLSPKQADEEQRLRQRLSDQQVKLAGLSPDSNRYASRRMALIASQDSLDGFLKQLEASNPAYYRYKYDNTTPSLTALRGYLDKQQSSLVTYFVGDSALYVMAVTGNKTTLRKQSIGVYNQTIHQFAPLLANTEAISKTADVNRFLTLSNNLYGQLLAPLALPKGRVVVSPDGFFIPFDALSRSASKPQYLVDDYAFSYVYSASLLLKNREMHRQLPGFRTRDFLGVAPVDFAPSLKQVILPNSDAALKPIAGRFASSTLLTHEAATRRAFLTQAATARIIHLFTHAVADSTDQEPKLYFADSTLKLSDLDNSALPNTQLVVLAACKTGIGANQRGEGVFSLARGFSALGVPSVLTALWSVQNEATYQLTDLFYSYLDQGLPKDIALQRAKQDWLKTADRTSQLPNYWAGLIVVGDAEPLSQTHYGLWLAGLAILVVMGLGSRWYWQKRKRQTLPVVVTSNPV